MTDPRLARPQQPSPPGRSSAHCVVLYGPAGTSIDDPEKDSC